MTAASRLAGRRGQEALVWWRPSPTASVADYITHRIKQGIVNKEGVRIADVSSAEINRELQTLKRIFNLAIDQDRIAMKPKSKLLKESEPRSGFFEREQIASEVLPLEWRHV